MSIADGLLFKFQEENGLKTEIFKVEVVEYFISKMKKIKNFNRQFKPMLNIFINKKVKSLEGKAREFCLTEFNEKIHPILYRYAFEVELGIDQSELTGIITNLQREGRLCVDTIVLESARAYLFSELDNNDFMVSKFREPDEFEYIINEVKLALEKERLKENIDNF